MADNDQTTEAPAAATDTDQPVFAQQRYYLKDASFEAPNTPAVFKDSYTPKINFNINNRTTRVEEGMYESVLRLTADVKQDDKTVFLAEVQYAGIYEIRNLDEQALEMVLNVSCPNLLFPFAKEALESMVVKASFPPLMLSPINFEAVYQQARAKKAAEAEAAAESNPQ